MTSKESRNDASPEPDLQDLGFGSRVSSEPRLRLLNRDGTFNVQRRGISRFQATTAYHALLEMPWWRFHLWIFCSYLVANALFALGFLACGPGAVQGLSKTTVTGRFLECFFFSVQTFTTVGFGHVTPSGTAANVLVTLDAFTGLVGFALATGLLFARFSRPTARIRFSKQAVIAPYRGMKGFEFRIANERRNVLIEVRARVIFTRMEQKRGRPIRRFHLLPLERDFVAFFPLNWTVVHPITPDSPLAGVTHEQLVQSEAEFLILVTAVDETFSQTVHTRSSYKAAEIRCDVRFADMFGHDEEGTLCVDLERIDEVEPA